MRIWQKGDSDDNDASDPIGGDEEPEEDQIDDEITLREIKKKSEFEKLLIENDSCLSALDD